MEEQITNRLALFKATVEKMIAINEESYSTNSRYGGKQETTRIRDYTMNEVKAIINTGDPDSMQELSLSYYYGSGFYRRIILYYAYHLTYSYLVIPHFKKKINEGAKINYYNALSFCEDFNIKPFCEHVAVKVLVDGGYYGCLVQKGKQVSIMDLPFSYCRSRFKGFSGLDIVELDIRYFLTIRDDEQRENAFKLYPKEVKKAYEKYILGKLTHPWVALTEGIGVHFKMDEERPLFINTITAVDNFETYRDLEFIKQENETKKIVVQHIPLKTDGEFAIEPEEAQELHNGAVHMLSNNTTIDVLTTYAEVAVESLADNRQTVNSNLETFQNMVYAESGASPQVFATTGNIALDQSLKNDLSLMMTLADQFSIFFTYILNTRLSTNSIDYNVTLLPISYYNTKEYIENTYKLACAGYSFLLPAIASGLTQKEFIDIKTLENDILDLQEMLIPLQISSTQSAEGDTGGAPKKDNTKKTEKTISNTGG